MLIQTPIPVVAAGAAFVVIILLFFGVFQLIKSSRKREALKQKVRGNFKTQTTLNTDQSQKKRQHNIKDGLLNAFSTVGEKANPSKTQVAHEKRLNYLQAGYRSPKAPQIFFGIKILLTLFFTLLFLILRVTVLRVLTPNNTILIFLFMSFLGFYGPDLYLRNKKDKRKKRILEGLPDVLDLLGLCVEAGIGLDFAFNRVADEMEITNKDISDELKYYNTEIRAGISREKGLNNLSMRTNLDEMKSLVTLLIQTEKFGTSVVQALRVYSETFRTERFQRAEEIAAKLPVKIVIPCILFIFPSIFVVILGSAAIQIYKNFIMR